jgi:hypothetical protein
MIFFVAPYQERFCIIVVDASSSGPEAACIGSLQTTNLTTLLHGRINCSLCCICDLLRYLGWVLICWQIMMQMPLTGHLLPNWMREQHLACACLFLLVPPDAWQEPWYAVSITDKNLMQISCVHLLLQ